jgi:hypothetical protein
VLGEDRATAYVPDRRASWTKVVNFGRRLTTFAQLEALRERAATSRA